MTKESFIKKWLGNPDKKYTPEFKDEMRDDLDKLFKSQQTDWDELTQQLYDFIYGFHRVNNFPSLDTFKSYVQKIILLQEFQSATKEQPSQDTGHLIEFGMYLSGHDAETIMQIYQDWNNSQTIRKE